MASRYELEVTISSAKDLKNVNWRHGPVMPYAVVWVDQNNKVSTRVDDHGDTCPHWDQKLVIPLPAAPIEDQSLYIDIVHAGREEDTKPLIGSARLKLRDVLNDVGMGERATRSLQLKRPSGRPHGKLDVAITIRDPSYRSRDSYYAQPYGVPPPASSRDYSAAGYGAPYSAPPPPANPYYSAAPPSGYPYGGYNAPPQTAAYGSYGYGEHQQPVYVQEEKKQSKFGGMGTGLAVGAVAGVLGGIALTEGFEALEDHVADEAAERVEDDLADDGDFDGGDDF